MRADYAYIQARLQARHGMRLSNTQWQQLEAQQGLSNFLHLSSETGLRSWVANLHPEEGIHVIENRLAGHFRDYVKQVSNWQPTQWRKATRWIAVLPDLPLIRQSISVASLPLWIEGHPALGMLTGTNPEERNHLLLQTEYAPLIREPDEELLVERWLAHWRSLFPRDARKLLPPLEKLVANIQRHTSRFSSLPSVKASSSRLELEQSLCHQFRRHEQQPVTAFIHLALVALDLERVRGNISRRMLFPETEEVMQ